MYHAIRSACDSRRSFISEPLNGSRGPTRHLWVLATQLHRQDGLCAGGATPIQHAAIRDVVAIKAARDHRTSCYHTTPTLRYTIMSCNWSYTIDSYSTYIPLHIYIYHLPCSTGETCYIGQVEVHPPYIPLFEHYGTACSCVIILNIRHPQHTQSLES